MTALENVTHIPGSTLVGDLRRNTVGSAKAYRYWVGLTKECPLGDISCGVSFPKTNEDLIQKEGESRTQRVSRVGAITQIDAARLHLIQEKLPRLVIRFRKHLGSGSFTPGKPTGDAPVETRYGELVEIPTAAEVATARASNGPTNEYVYREGDRPAAEFMFMQLCADQESGEQGYRVPETVNKTGIVWPEPASIEELLGN